MKKTKKIDVKKVAKENLQAKMLEWFASIGYDAEDGTEYGFTTGTSVVHLPDTDIQIKLVTPAAKVGTRYAKESVDED